MYALRPLVCGYSPVKQSPLPKISKRPHPEVLDHRIFLQVGLLTIFPRTSGPARPACCWLCFTHYWRFMSYHFVAVNLFLVLFRTRCASPAISSCWLGHERRLDAGHVEETPTTVAFDGILSETVVRYVRQDSWEMNAYGAHHALQASHSRMLSVRSVMISFSATTYS